MAEVEQLLQPRTEIPGALCPEIEISQQAKGLVADASEDLRHCVDALVATAAGQAILLDQADQQRKRVYDRCTTEQWLDENEREWKALDTMCRSRPWATRKDEQFPYPFREATNRMREIEGPWLGDDRPFAPDWTRSEHPCEVVTHFRPVPEFPPRNRLIIFTPEFGSEGSFEAMEWMKLPPVDATDIWIVCWQGWSNWDEMIVQVARQVLSFADACSTTWYGHSMGAIVAYEVLKIFEEHHTPNLPVALVVSGCPAPHLFEKEYKPWEKYKWLTAFKSERAFDDITDEQTEVLANQFQVRFEHSDLDWYTAAAVEMEAAALGAAQKFRGIPPLSPEQRTAIIGDLKVMRQYKFKHSRRPAWAPVIAISHDEDELVNQDSVKAWKEYAADGKFEHVPLEDFDDPELLAEQGHGYSAIPCKTLLNKLVQVNAQHQLSKDLKDLLIDIGPTDGPIPDEVDIVVVGAGVAGITNAKALAETGKSVLVFDRYNKIGGIWTFYANKFSRVNSSEPAYRLVNQMGPGSRPNEDHSPTHDILRDVYTLAGTRLYGKFRLNMDVFKTHKRADGTYDVMYRNKLTGTEHKIHCSVISFNVNRRIGQRRDVVWKDENKFRGDIVYGYANEVTPLHFWGKRVIVVGAGAFAFENLRTAMEHGAKHVTVLGRRAGTTCPKWIDMIAFLRPLGQFLETNKGGNVVSFEAWRNCYEHAGLKTPECWDEGLLKPHNHTVSVSDLVFIAGFHGMVDLKVGEIYRALDDGHRMELKDGSTIEADIIIKATGFLLNKQVPQITGYEKIYYNNLLDMNVAYGAEPLLDGGQFGSSKGKIEKEFASDQISDEVLEKGGKAVEFMGLDITPRNNPFGSSYVGGMNHGAYYLKWLVMNQDKQKALLRSIGNQRPLQTKCGLVTSAWQQ